MGDVIRTIAKAAFLRNTALCMLLLFAAGCQGWREPARFESVPASQSGVTFENRLHPDDELNIVDYLYYYDGAGVALADVDGDGLTDLFLVGNEGRHALYRNLGGFRFEDVTEASGIADPGDAPRPEGAGQAWSTGAAFADVNGDGHVDLFVARSSFGRLDAPHSLYINRGDGTFEDRAAEWGVDLRTHGTHAAFLDYDLDGRLDLYLLNHSFHSEKTYGPAPFLRGLPDERSGDRLLRNVGGRFEDVTAQAGIGSSALGYGLGVAVGDVNLDGWPDILVGNDFHENDYLYLNLGDGRFLDVADEWLPHTSNSSMGSDLADLNRDGWPEIVSLDMMPPDRETFMRSGGADLPIVARAKQGFGFLPHANHNTLQVHRGLDAFDNAVFVEMGMALGLARTDWSWAVLAADLTNSGLPDLFITNGMVKRPNDLDYLQKADALRRRQDAAAEQELIQQMPSSRTPNAAFENLGGFRFEPRARAWGLEAPGFSNGAAWGDLDGDGDLDLVVNDLNGPARLYRNTTRSAGSTGASDSTSRYLQVRLKGSAPNTLAIGSRVSAWSPSGMQTTELYLSRGFQSSVEPLIHFGLGSDSRIDSLRVDWPAGGVTRLVDVPADTLLVIEQPSESTRSSGASPNGRALFVPPGGNGLVARAGGIAGEERERRTRAGEADPRWSHGASSRFAVVQVPGLSNEPHIENQYDAFQQEPLVPYDPAALGPALAVGDLNGDGLDDLFIGGSHQYPARLLLQTSEGEYRPHAEPVLRDLAQGEDADALFYDADGDGDTDLYIARGGGQYAGAHALLQDVLLLQDEQGGLRPAVDRIPDLRFNASVVRKASNLPLVFVGGRSEVWSYGAPPRSALLAVGLGEGESPLLVDVTEQIAPSLARSGMVSDAVWADLTGDGREELVTAGEWSPIEVYQFSEDLATAERITDRLGFADSHGFWQSLHAVDLNGDGRVDLLAGNIGRNTRLRPDPERPISLMAHDFRGGGYASGVLVQRLDGTLMPFEQLDELRQEFPFLSDRVSSFGQYARMGMAELFPEIPVDDLPLLPLGEVRSMAWLSQPDGTYRPMPLPLFAQAGPIRSWISRPEANGAGVELIASGNLPFLRPSLGAPQDGLPFLHMVANPPRAADVDSTSGSALGSPSALSGSASAELTFEVLSPAQSGVFIRGVFPEVAFVNSAQGTRVIAVQQLRPPQVFVETD